MGDILLNYLRTFLMTLMRVFISAMVLLFYPLQLNSSQKPAMCVICAVQEMVAATRERRRRRRMRMRREAAGAAVRPEDEDKDKDEDKDDH